MSRDRREEILVRLFAIGGTFDVEVRNAYRNKDELGERDRPAFRLFDGDESSSESVVGPGGEHRGGGGHVMVMRPGIAIALSAPPETVGTDLNGKRIKLIKAVTTDTELLAICGRNGRIKYEGLSNAFGAGRAVEGEMTLLFSISYPLIPSEL